ncbi:MAG: hypothetical protein HY288_05285 [Planctomycetia bacterium]|nr:hypothetical protein [Planctomycetia bacterium]
MSSAGPAIFRSILGGFAGTLAITAMMYFVAPAMPGTHMDIANVLGSVLGGSWWVGMAMHFVIGALIFPLTYAVFFYDSLPGGPTLRGIALGVFLWLLAQAVMMPMIGAGFFSANAGGVRAIVGSLMAHVIYGALLGWISGPPK